MRNNSTVVATVIHNKSLKNLNAFLNTIYLQDDKKFDLLILNDSKEKISLKKIILLTFYHLNIIKV